MELTERRFHEAMMAVCERSRSRGAAAAARLLALIQDRGSVAAARHHLCSSGRPKRSSAGELSSEVSIETLVFDPEWGCLFTEEEKALARSRLEGDRDP